MPAAAEILELPAKNGAESAGGTINVSPLRGVSIQSLILNGMWCYSGKYKHIDHIIVSPHVCFPLFLTFLFVSPL